MAAGGTGSPRFIAACQRTTGAPLGTGGQGFPAARWVLRNTAIGARSFLMGGM